MNTQSISKTMFLLLLLVWPMYGCKNNTTVSKPGLKKPPGGPTQKNKKEYAYLAGGKSNASSLAEIYEFDPAATKKWTEVPGGELPKKISNAISFTLADKVYLAGGEE